MKLDVHSTTKDSEKFAADFCALPERVRQGEFRIGLLPSEIWARFLNYSSPFPKEFWVCYDGDSPIGRIGANILNQRHEVGFFGFLELDLDCDAPGASSLLLESACEWLAMHAARQAIGPVDLNTWFPYRFRLADGDPRCFDWEPVNPPKYVCLLESRGFDVAEHYSTTGFGDLPGYLEATAPAYERALQSGYHFRPFRSAQLERDIPALYRISIESFRRSFLFEPISETLFAQLYVSIQAKGKDSVSYFVMDRNGQEVGFLYGFIDHWQRGDEHEEMVVLKSIAVLPEARNLGLSNALSHLVVKHAHEQGIRYGVAALVRSGISSESYAKKGRFRWRHDYCLWKKALDIVT